MGSAANCSLEGAGGASFLPTGSAPGRGACLAAVGGFGFGRHLPLAEASAHPETHLSFGLSLIDR
jgi:hypothetical protein